MYIVREVFDDKIKATKVDESYDWKKGTFTLEDGTKVPWKYGKWNSKLGKYIEMTEEENSK